VRAFGATIYGGRVVFGAGAVRDALADEVERLGARRVLVVATERERPLVQRLAPELGERLAGTFSRVRPHVPVEIAEAARAAAADARADALMAVGGGSTIGTAKAIALTGRLPIIAVPTTYAGSEMTPVWGLTEGGRKTTGVDPVVLPAVVVYDPELTVTLPPAITGPSGMNAMAHCVEAFYAPGGNPITSLLAEEGIRRLAAGLPRAVDDGADLTGRGDALYGACLAGAAFASAGSGLHHRICHALGGAYDLPHAETHTAVLPHVVGFNAPAMPEIARRIARAVGADDAAAGLHDLAARLGAPLALRDIGLREDEIDEAAALVAIPEANPRPVAVADVRAIIAAAWEGARP
jgi:alcohol dehydrogenase class IV